MNDSLSQGEAGHTQTAEILKQSYAAPALVVHGMVKDLTAAGSGLRMEKRPNKGSWKKRG